MPSGEHESPIALTNLEPGLIAWLLANVFEVEVDDYHHVRPHPTEVKVPVPRTYNCDSMLVFCGADDQPLFAVVFEVQRRWDPDKLRTWKLYLANAEVELEVDVDLIVYCEQPATARRYRECLAARRGRSHSLHPYIFTPEDVPPIVDLDTARQNPALAVLSALCHGNQPDVDRLFPAVVEAMQATELAKAMLFYDVVVAGLPAPARQRWEDYMTTTENYRFQSEVLRANFAEGRAEGRAEGEAQAMLIVLKGRGIEVSDEVRDRVLACTDPAQIQTWLERVATAETIDDVITD